MFDFRTRHLTTEGIIKPAPSATTIRRSASAARWWAIANWAHPLVEGKTSQLVRPSC
jgi:hypothetical protein